MHLVERELPVLQKSSKSCWKIIFRMESEQQKHCKYETLVESATCAFPTLYVVHFIIIVSLAQYRQSVRR